LALERAATLSREMYEGAVTAHAAYEEARAMVARLTNAALKDAEVGPTTRQVVACEAARAQLQEVMQRWNALRTREAR
jgi:hypothetical protein